MADRGDAHVKLIEVGEVGSASKFVGGSKPMDGTAVKSAFPLLGSV